MSQNMQDKPLIDEVAEKVTGTVGGVWNGGRDLVEDQLGKEDNRGMRYLISGFGAFAAGLFASNTMFKINHGNPNTGDPGDNWLTKFGKRLLSVAATIGAFVGIDKLLRSSVDNKPEDPMDRPDVVGPVIEEGAEATADTETPDADVTAEAQNAVTPVSSTYGSSPAEIGSSFSTSVGDPFTQSYIFRPDGSFFSFDPATPSGTFAQSAYNIGTLDSLFPQSVGVGPSRISEESLENVELLSFTPLK